MSFVKFVVTLLLSLASALSAAEIKLVWDAAPPPVPPAAKVTAWRVYRMEGAARTLLATVTSPAVTIQGEPGQVIGVTAFNGLESQPVTITLPSQPSPPTGLRVVEIQTSANLKDWKTIAYVPLHEAGESSRFVRSKISEVLPAP